ncbi:hypothetical protein M378DRAFT_19162 [Amanita muscaria Koide BX008]|uniref:Uncharacterized protein n=1 Tax=Amanita muscaria (strain Koide BX008) TaxID=946122 RepID=A0A0C2SJS0_AMAMK|nr:hypothetical protein M378DRAFT_19162 [Amanita muscaria Koide BX008]
MPVSDSYSSSTVPRTESSELVTIPELDEESNNSERPESTILADGIPLPLSMSYKRVVNFLERCNDDDMGEVEAGERKGMDYHDCDTVMDIDSDSDADDSELDCDDSESDGMSTNARKVPQRGRPKKAVHGSGSKQLGSRSWDSQPPEPDPDFVIQCSVVNTEGSNIPFSINSTITLENLRTLIAEKLDQSEDAQAIRLQYRLDSDKAKMAPTSIRSQEELKIFVLKMRHLIVPPLLSSGKISTRKLKPVTTTLYKGETSEDQVRE